MIDRGALVLARTGAAYRGPHRPALDAQPFTGRKGKALAERYRARLTDGEGVLEDLDDAIAMRDECARIGAGELEVLVFEVPQEPAPTGRSLPIAPTPPAEGLAMLGYDVIELLEPYWSPLAGYAPDEGNEFGLYRTRAEADAHASTHNAREDLEDPLVTVRVWLLERS